jgi:tetratricopeptide (TPR) repeat protein
MRPSRAGFLCIAVFCAVAATARAEHATSFDAESADRLTHALTAEEQQNGPSAPHLLPLLDQLAQLRFREGNLAETASLRRRALGIAVRAFGCDSARAAAAMTSLATIEIDRRRYFYAEPLLIAAKNVLTAGETADGPLLATVLTGLARIALAHGEPEAAQKWAETAAEIASRDPDRRVTEALRTVAAAWVAKERFANSEHLLRQALTLDRNHDGPDGIDVARTLSQLGNLYLRQKRFAEAVAAIEDAMDIDQRELGASHPFIADDFYDLSLAYDALKRPETARKALTFAVKLLERDGSRTQEPVRLGYAKRELARMLRVQGKTEEADEVAAESHRLLDAAEAEDHERQRQI